MSYLSSRRVMRFYIFGKGYNSATNAYRAVAKRELISKATAYANGRMDGKIEGPLVIDWKDEKGGLSQAELDELFLLLIREFYATLFPNSCHYTGRLQYDPATDKSWGAKKAFCNHCRRQWIDARAKEIQALDQAGEYEPAEAEIPLWRR